MGPQDLPVICASALAAVFLILTLMFLVTGTILTVYQQKPSRYDAGILTAVAAMASSIYSRKKITRFKEIK